MIQSAKLIQDVDSRSESIKRKEYIWVVAILFLLAPYVSPIKIETDVQPFGILLAIIAFVINEGIYTATKLKLEKSDALMIAISLIYITTTFFTEGGIADFMKTGGLLSTVILYIVLSNVSDDVVKKSIHIYTVLLSIITLAYIFGMEEYFHYFYNYKEINDSRGLSILSPEPTDMAYTSSIIYIVYKNLKLTKSRTVEIALISSIILTGSLLGLLVVCYLMVKLIANKIKYFGVAIVCIIAVTYGFNKINLEIEDGPIGRVSAIVTKISSQDILTAILNTSAYYRIIMIDAGACGALKNFLLPQGYGQFKNNVNNVDNACEITERYSNYVYLYDNYIYYIGNDMKVNVAKLLYELGFIGVFAIAILLKKVRAKKHGVFAIILYLIQSTPLGHPTIALILKK